MYDWRIDGTLATDRMDEVPTPQIGQEITYSFTFDPRRANALPADERHTTVLGRLEYAGDDTLDIYRPITGPPMYRDQSPEGYDPLVGIDIADEAATGTGATGRPLHVPRVWGVIVGGADTTPAHAAHYSLELTVLVLAPLGEYDDRAAVRADLEADGPAP